MIDNPNSSCLVAHPPGFQVQKNDDLQLQFRAPNTGAIAYSILMVLFIVLLAFGLFIWDAEDSLLSVVIALVFIVMGTVAIYKHLASLINRTHIRIRDGKIDASSGPLPFVGAKCNGQRISGVNVRSEMHRRRSSSRRSGNREFRFFRSYSIYGINEAGNEFPIYQNIEGSPTLPFAIAGEISQALHRYDGIWKAADRMGMHGRYMMQEDAKKFLDRSSEPVAETPAESGRLSSRLGDWTDALVALLGLIFVLVPVGLYFAMLAEDTEEGIPVSVLYGLVVFIVAGLGILYFGLARFINKQTLLIGSSLDVKIGPLPWPGSASIAADSVRGIYVRDHHQNHKSPVTDTFRLYAVDDNQQEVLLVRNIDRIEKALALEMALEKELGLSPHPVAGEALR